MQQLIDRHTSTGNQLKWIENDKYYKQDTYGYEALSEYIVSFILNELQVLDYIPYSLFSKGICSSYNFLNQGEIILTIDNILMQTMTVKEFKYFERKSLTDRFKLVCEKVINFTNLESFRDYLIKLLHIDFIILNDDRHYTK